LSADFGICQASLSELIMWKMCLVSERAWMSYNHLHSELANGSELGNAMAKVREQR
jgi:hypothetical protein